ncbi:hypothetical protein KQH82_02500 [bacterium]|nr:hypothetical protein [bacterium]
MKQGLFRIQSASVDKGYRRALNRAIRDDVVRKLMARDPKPLAKDAATRKLVKNRLGWTDSAALMKKNVRSIETFGQSVLKDGIRHIVVMGMGGSSLCPEVFALMFGKHDKVKTFHVMDSTAPEAIARVLRSIDITKALGIVASKSGGTVETRSQEALFLKALSLAGVKRPGRHMAAITDKGSTLEKWAKAHRYRKTFINPSDIGGRFSALSYFGLVPGFFGGVDLRALLDYALAMQKMIAERGDATNPALVLGTLMASAAKAGRDKLTFVASKKCAPFVPWLEQLIAESTGKKRKGVVPIEGEPALSAKHYSKDRLYVNMHMTSERPAMSDALRRQLTRTGAPIIDVVLRDAHELGGQFLLWEAATAVAGYHFGINPFDEPNVTESKDYTKKLLATFEKAGALPIPEPVTEFNGMTVLALDAKQKVRATDTKTPSAVMKRFLSGMKAPEYVSVLSYCAMERTTETAVTSLRKKITSKNGVATLRGYGPRYLHSIGQLYKGGPLNGRFIVVVQKKYRTLAIPGASYDFGTLITAQALGDIQALRKRKLPVLVLLVDGKPAEALAKLTRSV